jgi:hypothetical protein
MEEVMEEADIELVVVEVITTQLVEEEDAEVEVIAVTTQLMEEEDVELMEADAVIVAEMEAVTEGKKRRCDSMALRRNAEVPWERMSQGQ